MPVLVRCTCGNAYNLKDEFAGKLVQCPRCGQNLLVPSETAEVSQRGTPPFDRDVYLLRQRVLAISEKYSVDDENKNPLFYVERPVFLLRDLLAVIAGGLAFLVVFIIFFIAAEATRENEIVSVLFRILAILLGALAFFFVFLAIIRKRHVTFWRDPSKQEPLLHIIQDRKFMPIIATYTVSDSEGNVLARLRKNIFTNIFRRKWTCFRPDGSVWVTAKEDSIILALLRRFIGPLFGILRTNFIICDGQTDEVIGEFNRKFTLLDRYVLDMRADPEGRLDRRVALALAVMLDTGEKR